MITHLLPPSASKTKTKMTTKTIDATVNLPLSDPGMSEPIIGSVSDSTEQPRRSNQRFVQRNDNRDHVRSIDVPTRSPNDDDDRSSRFRISQNDLLAPLLTESTSLAWLIEGALLANQPAVIGAEKKTLKTSLAIDMAISLAAGKPFLGEFSVTQPINVAMLTDDDAATVFAKAKCICISKGIDPGSCGVHWGFQLPALCRDGDMDALGEVLDYKQIEVLIVDSFHACLLAGDQQRRQSSNLFDIGPVLSRFGEVCRKNGTTPILVQQARRRQKKPLVLDDLLLAGIAEFARQWLLLSPQEEHKPADGDHKLLLNIGGNSGHKGLYNVGVFEGALKKDLGDRKWIVNVMPY